MTRNSEFKQLLDKVDETFAHLMKLHDAKAEKQGIDNSVTPVVVTQADEDLALAELRYDAAWKELSEYQDKLLSKD
ncbi:hypothetical protein [Paenarthrobacter nitroguajacolicus]|uniref:hypothetical protein n=1 Tax=Paenarthrobacter nitroguajacolicus TaxID=211146 RepID=UPI000A55D078|nr:hypothetical protein [Paenarthrobacter nitroguajacolicus]